MSNFENNASPLGVEHVETCRLTYCTQKCAL